MVSKKDKFTKDKFKLVLVEWTDAMDFDNGWHDLKKIQAAQVEQVVSVGWIVTEDDKHIVLSSDFCSDCTSGRAIAIPKDWCQKITTLEEMQNE